MDFESAKRFLLRLKHWLRFDELSPTVRRFIVGVIGGLVLLAGFALIFLPGPAFVVIPLGLAILATEFAWARHYLLKLRGYFEKMTKRARKKKNPPAEKDRVNVRGSRPAGPS
jgi:uncharacterized protein (TIGR02611 family)